MQNRQQVEALVHECVHEMMEMYDLPETSLTPEMLLIKNLGCSSIDIMHLLASLDMRLQKHLPYDNLIMKEGAYVQDISIADITEFVTAHLDWQQAEPRNLYGA